MNRGPSVEEFAFSAARVTPEVAHWRDGRATDHIELIERCRDVNERVRSLGCTAWPALERVSVGHVLDLYMLALPSAVRCVEIQALSEGTLWMLPHVLEDARPVELTLGLFAREHVLECIPHLLAPGESTANLRKLALEIQCDLEFEISIGITLVSHTLPYPSSALRQTLTSRFRRRGYPPFWRLLRSNICHFI